jgi:hypothetical protein
MHAKPPQQFTGAGPQRSKLVRIQSFFSLPSTIACQIDVLQAESQEGLFEYVIQNNPGSEFTVPWYQLAGWKSNSRFGDGVSGCR